MDKVIIIGGVLLLYGIIIFLLIKWSKNAHRKSMIKVANEMVKSGELTREQGDSIIWLINKTLDKT